MNPFTVVLFLVLAGWLWSAPRSRALMPFLAGCCWMTAGQGIDLGPVSLPMYRLLLLIGFGRIITRKESLVGGVNLIDKLMIAWAVWYLFSSFFHDSTLEGAGPNYVAGQIFNQLGFYFLVRVWCDSIDEVTHVIGFLAWILLPVAIEMMFEQLSGKNLFSVFGRVPENVIIREGRLRAQGPFLHPILAGTVGASCVPLFISIFRKHRTTAIVGVGAGFAMTIASASSGPVMALIFAMGALGAWKVRHSFSFRGIAIVAAIAYFLLSFTMEKPPYYLIARIDISGGSTGWHRCFLIEQTINHLSEWWLFGTDHTRHWMPMQGVASSPTHTDITNYYIGFGVNSGLLGMGLIIASFLVAFKWVGTTSQAMGEAGRDHEEFMVWCFGASLFSHAASSISVAYFDQSSAFVWLTVAVIASMRSAVNEDYEEEDETVESEQEIDLNSMRWS